MRPLRFLLLAIALSAVPAAAEPVAWRVVTVHDGDTLTALDAANVRPGTLPRRARITWRDRSGSCAGDARRLRR